MMTILSQERVHCLASLMIRISYSVKLPATACELHAQPFLLTLLKALPSRSQSTLQFAVTSHRSRQKLLDLLLRHSVRLHGAIQYNDSIWAHPVPDDDSDEL